MQNKFCRICWNTSGWRIPTGERIERGSSYVAEHGFGHEEWLFNYEWLIDGFRYGFLQPIGKHLAKYMGDHCSITLYTLTPDSNILLIGRIDSVYVPHSNELRHVLDTYAERGWLNQMRNHVTDVGGDIGDLENPQPPAIANVRFLPEDVTIFDPRPRVVGNHTIVNNLRYHPFDWIDDYPATEIQPPPHLLGDPRRSEHERTRAAQEASTVDPKHTRLQNRLYQHLCMLHGPENIRYEHNYVDLILSEPEGDVYFEIKIEPSAKRCIRLALGQLLEYAHYPHDCRAEKFVVVGDAPVSQDDENYLVYLRETYKLPIYYSRFLWEHGELEPAC